MKLGRCVIGIKFSKMQVEFEDGVFPVLSEYLGLNPISSGQYWNTHLCTPVYCNAHLWRRGWCHSIADHHRHV